jgi:exodeoxyribonuclease V alpha subunit
MLNRLRHAECRKVTPVLDGEENGKKWELKYQQPEACKNACENAISVLCGLPGTGKTTTLRATVSSFVNAGMKVVVLGPTGAASKRASSIINAGSIDEAIPCYTVHSYLGYNPAFDKFKYNRRNKRCDADVVVVDEFPMLDTILARNIVESIDHRKTRLVLQGDPHQLPSVSAGNIGHDIIRSGVFKQVMLDKVLRQGANSGIVHNANRVIKGEKLITADPVTGETFTDFFFVNKEGENGQEEARDYIKTIVHKKLVERRGYDPMKDIQVLCPGHKSIIGVKELNKHMQELLNPNGKKMASWLRVGDKVVNNKNNWNLNIVNGDVGYIIGHKMERDSDGELDNRYDVDFGPGAGPNGDGIVSLTIDQLTNLSLGYASTVHKSQGSEYRCVIMPLFCAHYTLLYRNLLYTGMTRARELLVLVGEKKALGMAIRNNSPSKRMSNLETILRTADTYFTGI